MDCVMRIGIIDSVNWQ